ncbi:unnamed protein product [Ectocarpus sp. 13 AM-2016]
METTSPPGWRHSTTRLTFSAAARPTPTRRARSAFSPWPGRAPSSWSAPPTTWARSCPPSTACPSTARPTSRRASRSPSSRSSTVVTSTGGRGSSSLCRLLSRTR